MEPEPIGTAVVTGGSRGIGLAIVEALADRGWTVITVARTPQPDTAPNVVGINADLATAEGTRRCLEAIRQHADRLDLLVNNAGAIQPREAVAEVSEEALAQSWQLHVVTPLVLTRGLVPLLETSPHPAVVNVGSVYGRIIDPEVVAYGASKAALDYLTGALAIALAPAIRVNAVVPGHIDTDMTRGAPTEFVDEIVAQTALHRLGSTREVVDAVLFLASTDSSFVTGASLRLDGGFRPRP